MQNEQLFEDFEPVEITQSEVSSTIFTDFCVSGLLHHSMYISYFVFYQIKIYLFFLNQSVEISFSSERHKSHRRMSSTSLFNWSAEVFALG